MAAPWPWLVPLALIAPSPGDAADDPPPQAIPEGRRQELPAARRPALAAPRLPPMPPPEVELALLRPPSPQQPEPKPAPQGRAVRVVVPEQPILAFPVPVTPRRISLVVDGRTLQMEDPPRLTMNGGDAAPDPQPDVFFRRVMAFSSENFDRLVFGGRDPETRRQALHDTLAAWIKGVELGRRLDPAERRRLELAGIGDIERYLRRVEAARSVFEANRFDYERGRAVISALATLGHEFDAGPFGPGSLFHKVSIKLMMDDLADPLRLDRPAGKTPPSGAGR